MPLKIRTVTTHRVDCYDLDAFINASYPGGKPFNFVADQEAGNDSSHTFTVSTGVLDDYDQGKVNAFAAGKGGGFLASALLNDMCVQGLIPAGYYTIEVCW